MSTLPSRPWTAKKPDIRVEGNRISGPTERGGWDAEARRRAAAGTAGAIQSDFVSTSGPEIPRPIPNASPPGFAYVPEDASPPGGTADPRSVGWTDQSEVWQGPCGHIWYRGHDGIECPRCRSETLYAETRTQLDRIRNRGHEHSWIAAGIVSLPRWHAALDDMMSVPTLVSTCTFVGCREVDCRELRLPAVES